MNFTNILSIVAGNHCDLITKQHKVRKKKEHSVLENMVSHFCGLLFIISFVLVSPSFSIAPL